MIDEWILLMALFSPGGDFIGKVPVTMPSHVACKQAVKTLVKKVDDPMGMQYRGVCVTKAHWTGAEPMKNVPLD